MLRLPKRTPAPPLRPSAHCSALLGSVLQGFKPFHHLRHHAVFTATVAAVDLVNPEVRERVLIHLLAPSSTERGYPYAKDLPNCLPNPSIG